MSRTRPIARLSSPPTIKRRGPDRPTADLGRQVRLVRKAAGLTHETLAQMTGMRAEQMSILETGHNVHASQYTLIAKALGYQGALELFRASDADPKRQHLDRAWALLSDTQRARALRFCNRLLVGDE